MFGWVGGRDAPATLTYVAGRATFPPPALTTLHVHSLPVRAQKGRRTCPSWALSSRFRSMFRSKRAPHKRVCLCVCVCGGTRRCASAAGPPQSQPNPPPPPSPLQCAPSFCPPHPRFRPAKDPREGQRKHREGQRKHREGQRKTQRRPEKT